MPPATLLLRLCKKKKKVILINVWPANRQDTNPGPPFGAAAQCENPSLPCRENLMTQGGAGSLPG